MTIRELIEALEAIEKTEGNIEIYQRTPGTQNSERYVSYIDGLEELGTVTMCDGQTIFKFY